MDTWNGPKLSRLERFHSTCTMYFKGDNTMYRIVHYEQVHIHAQIPPYFWNWQSYMHLLPANEPTLEKLQCTVGWRFLNHRRSFSSADTPSPGDKAHISDCTNHKIPQYKLVCTTNWMPSCVHAIITQLIMYTYIQLCTDVLQHVHCTCVCVYDSHTLYWKCQRHNFLYLNFWYSLTFIIESSKSA